jgi:hypothetical protein
MSSIIISNLHPAGSDLLSDSESYITELSEAELGIQGGLKPLQDWLRSWLLPC